MELRAFLFLTAVANEYVRRTFQDEQLYYILGQEMNGVNVWILFKIAIVLPISGLYAWVLSRQMQKHRIPDPANES